MCGVNMNDDFTEALTAFLYRHQIGHYACIDTTRLAVHLIEEIEKVKQERLYGKLSKVLNLAYETIGYE